MSNCRTFHRSSRKEQQPKQQNPGILRLNELAYDIITKDPEKILNHLVFLFIDEKKVTAGGMIIKLASGAILEVCEEQPGRRPSLIDRWTLEAEQQDKEKKQKEAEAAQEAAARELGQIAEPETAVEPAPAPQPQPAAANSNISNTHINEIGLPVVNQSNLMDSSGLRLCRTATPRPGASTHEPKQAVLNQSGASIYA